MVWPVSLQANKIMATLSHTCINRLNDNTMKLNLFILLIITTICFTSCHDEGTTINYDVELPEPTEPEQENNLRDTLDLTNRETIYQLEEFNESGIAGLARFIEIADSGGFLVVIEIQAGVEGAVIPVIETGHYREGGEEILLTLNPVDPETGVSETIVSQLNNGDSITYLESKDLDAHLQLNLDKQPVAVADMGINIFVNEEILELNQADFPDINGELTVLIRRNGKSVFIIEMDGLETGLYPAHFHNNSSEVEITLNPVDGETGMSETVVDSLDNGRSFDGNLFILSIVPGYIEVHDKDNYSLIVGRKPFGFLNNGVESTGYELQEENNSGVESFLTYLGIINFLNKVGSPTAIVRLHHTASYPQPYAEIRYGPIDGGGDLALSFKNFKEVNALEKFGVVKEAKLTSISSLEDGTSTSYEEITKLESHMLVYSDSTKTELIAKANLNN